MFRESGTMLKKPEKVRGESPLREVLESMKSEKRLARAAVRAYYRKIALQRLSAPEKHKVC